MKANRPHNPASAASLQGDHATKSVPSVKEIVALLLAGHAIDHQDIIRLHDGKQHRLGLTIARLRHKYGLKGLIQCPRSKNHPKAYCYYIEPLDMPAALEIARARGLVKG